MFWSWWLHHFHFLDLWPLPAAESYSKVLEAPGQLQNLENCFSDIFFRLRDTFPVCLQWWLWGYFDELVAEKFCDTFSPPYPIWKLPPPTMVLWLRTLKKTSDCEMFSPFWNLFRAVAKKKNIKPSSVLHWRCWFPVFILTVTV